MRQHPVTTVEFLAVCENVFCVGFDVADLQDQALRHLPYRYSLHVLSREECRLDLLSACLLGRILKGQNWEALCKFRTITKWAIGGSEADAEEREGEAAELISEHVDLACIKPSQLSAVVQRSGLVTAEMIEGALAAQAVCSITQQYPPGAPAWLRTLPQEETRVDLLSSSLLGDILRNGRAHADPFENFQLVRSGLSLVLLRSARAEKEKQQTSYPATSTLPTLHQPSFARWYSHRDS